MLNFPALKPMARSYSLGIYPVTAEPNFGGGSVRFIHGYKASGHELELQYTALTQANAKLIRDHYRDRQGGMLAFVLSAEAWAGNDNPPPISTSIILWKYASPPREEHLLDGRINVTVNLVSVI